MNLRKNLNPTVLIAGTLMAATALAGTHDDGSHMMGGDGTDWMGGYGGIWVPILLVAVIAGLVGWVIAKKRK